MIDINRKTELLERLVQLANRATGESTRLADKYIQELYENQNEWVVIYGHFPSREADRQLLEIIMRRMSLEHGIDKIKVDRIKNRLKLISYSRDAIREEMEKINEEMEKLEK